MSDVPRGPDWWQASDHQWYPPRWEYRVEQFDLRLNQKRADERLAELGTQGWEAVGTFGQPMKGVGVLLKRMLP